MKTLIHTLVKKQTTTASTRKNATLPLNRKETREAVTALLTGATCLLDFKDQYGQEVVLPVGTTLTPTLLARILFDDLRLIPVKLDLASQVDELIWTVYLAEKAEKHAQARPLSQSAAISKVDVKPSDLEANRLAKTSSPASISAEEARNAS